MNETNAKILTFTDSCMHYRQDALQSADTADSNHVIAA